MFWFTVMLSTLEVRELWFVGPRTVELRTSPAREPLSHEVVVRAYASGVSQGTELLLYRGEAPERFDTSLGGAPDAPTYPRRYGYAWVGEVVARGADVRLREGTVVFSLAPHGDLHVLDAADVKPLPKGLSCLRAVLAANLETAITCVWDANVSLGDRAVVLGGGVVGLLTAWLLGRSGATVTVVEPSDKRRTAGRVLAPDVTYVDSDDAPPDGTADVVIEATGDPAMLDIAIAWARPEARIVVASFYGRRRAPIDLGDAFHRRRLELRSSQVSSLPPRLRERWTYARRWDFVLSLLGEAALDALLEPVAFQDAPQLYASLDSGSDKAPAHVFVYR